MIPENLSIHILGTSVNSCFYSGLIDRLIDRASLVDVIMIYSYVPASLENDGASFEILT